MRFVYVIALIVLPSLSNQVPANSMRPLVDAMADNPPEQALAYAGRRCTALFLGMMTRYRGSGRKDPDSEKLLQAFEERYAAWFALGMELTMREPAKQNSSEFFIDSVTRTVKAYSDRWDNNFDLSGNSFGEMTSLDSQLCNHLMSLILEQEGARK